MKTDEELPDLDELVEARFTSAIFRRSVGVLHPDKDAQHYIDDEITEYVRSLGELTVGWNWYPASPLTVYRAGVKALQLRAAAGLGLRLPPTLISSDLKSIASFIGDGPSIVKPLRAQTTTVNGKHRWMGTVPIEKAEDRLRMAPAIYQRRLSIKSEVRVAVFGPNVYAFEATHEQSDYRDIKDIADDVVYRPVAFPEAEGDALRALVSALGLSFSCADFVLDDDGDWYFLELNPNGQWYFLQEDSGVDLMDTFCAIQHFVSESA